MADIHTRNEARIKQNPFWTFQVKQFAVFKFEFNRKNKDLYLWVIDKKCLQGEMDEDERIFEIDENRLPKDDQVRLNEKQILVRVVSADRNTYGVLTKYLAGLLFYELKDRKWALSARLNIAQYAQNKNRVYLRSRLNEPVLKLNNLNEVVGESPWDKPKGNFKPGLTAYHDEDYRAYKEYAGISGAIYQYAKIRIIENESIRQPVTYLNNLLEISFDLLNAFSSDSKISVLYVPK